MNTGEEPRTELEIAITNVYRGPLDDFVVRRAALAKELRVAGQRDAASTVKALPKPSRMAWALDQSALEHTEAFARLEATLTDTLHAHATGGDVRSAIAQLRAAARDVAVHATHAAERAGFDIQTSDLTNALLAVLATPESYKQLRVGVLVDVPEAAAGVDFLASLPALPVPVAAVTPPKPRRAASERKVIVQEFVTLDGFVANSNGGVDFIAAATEGDQALAQRQLRFMDTIDVILLGRLTHQMFADYWPNVTSGEDKPFADKINVIPKIVFSKKRKRATWGEFEETAVSNDAVAEVTRLKSEPGKNMVVWGSISVARALTNAGLVDEFQLIICPVILGKGKSLFRTQLDAIDLKLRNSQSFDRGTILLSYAAEKHMPV